jgi:hypothetical protein
MAKAFIAAVPLALALVAAVVVPLALIPGTFGFRSWPTSPTAAPRDNAVVLEQPLELSGGPRSVVATRPPLVRDAVAPRHGALVARADAPAPRVTKVPGDRPSAGGHAAAPSAPAPAKPDPAGTTDQTPSGPQPAPQPAPAPDPAASPDLVAQQPDPAPDPAPATDARPVAPPSGGYGGGNITDVPRVIVGAVTGQIGGGDRRGGHDGHGRGGDWPARGRRD